MEKSNNSRFIGWQGVILAIVVVVAGLPGLAHCQTAGTALLLQQSPVNGGTITPSVGVHHFDLNTDVTLTAIPKPGYQFVYWLGDVSDPTASRTVAYLDAPKIIIAVFERVAYEFLARKRRATSTPAHRLMRHAADYARGGYSGGGGRRLDGWTPPTPPSPPEEPDFPVPIPEPATVVLLALGSFSALAGLAGRRPKRHA